MPLGRNNKVCLRQVYLSVGGVTMPECQTIPTPTPAPIIYIEDQERAIPADRQRTRETRARVLRELQG